MAEENRLRGNDRVFEFSKLNDKAPLTNQGTFDTRLFTGDNKLHAMFDGETGFWFCKYDHGAVPPALQQKFTNYSKLLEFIGNYYRNRNIAVKEIY